MEEDSRGFSKEKSTILKLLRKQLEKGIQMIDNDECSESFVIGTLSRFNAESKGFYDNDSLVNYDDAMRILNLRSRNNFRDLCRIFCIEQVKINNMRVGFKKSEIEELRDRLNNNPPTLYEKMIKRGSK